MTTRQRLIELAASQLRRNGAYDERCAHEAVEHVAIHKMGGEYRSYYEGISQDALVRLIKATARRAQEQTRGMR